MSQFEQRANIEFMCKLGKSASETLLALQQVYGDTALKKSAVYYWFSRCKDGQETLEDDERSGRSSTFRAEKFLEKKKTKEKEKENEKENEKKKKMKENQEEEEKETWKKKEDEGGREDVEEEKKPKEKMEKKKRPRF
ncbi:hypothetical protein B7P43_G09052 [Cryptotermes secundus]|uniref:Mos1 transposase HTH domain-containing protein n=1 Tax=Cryptotermes secundus TaxID=105785 RepID=A0A2J7PHQ0_9NEOP|nr:hypothetical protein B7P43_G09052 [Cryptotermes secundus]